MDFFAGTWGSGPIFFNTLGEVRKELEALKAFRAFAREAAVSKTPPITIPSFILVTLVF